MKELFIIAGPNGAGKTTTAFTLLPNFINVAEYVNADSIAHALFPFHPDKVAIQAGKLMLERIHNLVKQQRNFAFETTLASKSFVQLLKNCKANGYKTNLVFPWLHNVELAINRVKLRAKQGGHSIPVTTIRRRYKRGLQNFFNLYASIVDSWWVYDNSEEYPKIICQQLQNQPIKILKNNDWNLLLCKLKGQKDEHK